METGPDAGGGDYSCVGSRPARKAIRELIGGYRMARMVTTAAVILILALAVGCENSNTGLGQKKPQRTNPYVSNPSDPTVLAASSSADEIDLVEKMAEHREAYRRSLQVLIQHYETAGNYEKTTWARQELDALDRIPQYRYIIEAQVMPADLKAVESIPAADELYEQAVKIDRDAGALPVLKNEETLRAALEKYGEVIRQYPTSDKIDDVAYRMGLIHEYFNDFTIALQYYQRAYQWDPTTPYPARFKAASILDRRLRRRAEAVELYQEAIIKEAQFTYERSIAERRIKELTTSGDRTR
jgi:tetratricopeptide (TPR) repeat protein